MFEPIYWISYVHIRLGEVQTCPDHVSPISYIFVPVKEPNQSDKETYAHKDMRIGEECRCVNLISANENNSYPMKLTT